jgi:ribosome-binding factor A
VDGSGIFWLFGGNGYDNDGEFGVLDDLWKYNPSSGNWTWVAGSNTADPTGVFGTEGTANAANIPPPRAGAMEWTDIAGNFWLFAGLSDSDVVNDLWRFNAPGAATGTAATPTFSEPGGTYSAAQSVTISDTTPNSTIFYTTDGTTPTTSSAEYSGAISVPSTETIEAIAVASGFSNSAVASATYTLNLPAAATPVISPAPGTYSSAQSVTITDSTAGAIIYFTTDGTTPTASSTVYTGAISVSTTETIEAIAFASGYTSSAVASAAYTINLTAATPIISPAAGTYTSAQSVTITDATAGATIYYTTNGTTPTASSSVYSGAISVSASETIEAIAVVSGYANSAVASAAYTINLTAATPMISPTAGTYTSVQSVTITDATAGATIYYTTNGTTPTASSSVYSGAISVSASETIEAIAVASGFSNSAAASAAYIINLPAAATPMISPAAGTYTSAQSVTVTDSTAGATVYYTTNGTTPTASSSVYSGAISVSATETVEAIAVVSGFSNSAVASAAYTINLPAATPVISPAAGTYTSVQSVTITDATAGATVYYTTNGTTPTAASAVYGGAISVSATETVEAIAVAGGFSNSAVASAAYTINLPAATPVISPAAGTYTSAQSVTITDSTAGATIYYTTNGTTPTASSAVYGGAISVSTTETIEAIAVATGFTTSAVATADYVVTLPPPSFTLAASPSPLIIQSGSSGTTIITVTPTGGFTGTLSFNCGALPTDASCSFSPASVTATSGGSAPTTTLTVGTNGTNTASLRTGPGGTFLPEIFVAMILLPLGFTRRVLRTRKAGSRWLMGLLLLATASLAAAGMAGITGCGGKSSTSNSTPPGSYTIVIDATSGGTTIPLNLPITVQ